MNAPAASPADALRALMYSEERTEVECQPYLRYASEMLAPVMATVTERIEQQVGMAGRSDYFLICEVREITLKREVALWEAKAPQLAAFEARSRTRLEPSRDLVSAENQLLNYLDEYRSSGTFLERYRIRHASDVKLGGIIIGRDDNFVQSFVDDLSAETLRNMAVGALRIRDSHFYAGKLKVLSWDRVLDVLSAPPVTRS